MHGQTIMELKARLKEVEERLFLVRRRRNGSDVVEGALADEAASLRSALHRRVREAAERGTLGSEA
jgi:hypothetical protein